MPDLKIVVPRSKCPGNRRGHTWKELPLDAHSTFYGQYDLRRCGRCGARGRVNKQGLIDIVEIRA